METTNKVTDSKFNNLDDKTKLALALELKKESKATKVKEIINIDLDDINLLNELKKINVKNPISTNSGTEQEKKYKYESLIKDYITLSKEEKRKQEKIIRVKARKQRNKFLNNILFYFQEKNEKELKESIKLFKVFYLATYFLNDYSINSLADSRSDDDNILKVKLILNIIKNQK